MFFFSLEECCNKMSNILKEEEWIEAIKKQIACLNSETIIFWSEANRQSIHAVDFPCIMCLHGHYQSKLNQLELLFYCLSIEEATGTIELFLKMAADEPQQVTELLFAEELDIRNIGLILQKYDIKRR